MREIADCLWRRRFIGNEAAGFVRAVAEGALRRLAAAAEGDGRFVGRDFEFGAAGVDQSERAFDDERAVGAHADGDVGHLWALKKLSREKRGDEPSPGP